MGIRLTSDELTGLSRGLGADETAQVGMGHACVQRARGGHAELPQLECVYRLSSVSTCVTGRNEI